MIVQGSDSFTSRLIVLRSCTAGDAAVPTEHYNSPDPALNAALAALEAGGPIDPPMPLEGADFWLWRICRFLSLDCRCVQPASELSPIRTL